MTRRAAFSENFSSARHHGSIRGDVSLSARHVSEVKWLKRAEKGGDICQTLFGRAPENRMLLRIGNLERFLRRKANQTVVTCQPILGKHTDIDVNTDSRASDTDGIRPIFQNVRDRPHL